jgi:hypothetical protein
MTKNYIWVTTQFEGFHAYKDAPVEVAFLRNSHRHIFHVKVYIEVFHNNRDIEFILFKQFIENLCSTLNKQDLGSCEMISDKLHQDIISKYPNRSIIIEVSEDQENGCICQY